MYPQSPLGMRLRIAPGADLTTDPDTYPWLDVTEDLELSKAYPITLKDGGEDEEQETSTELDLTIRNNSGRYTTDNPESDLWPSFDQNTPVEFAVDPGTGLTVQAVQYLSSAVDSWPGKSGQLCLTTVVASGLLRRLQQGADVMSALRRAIRAEAPTVYWPLEEGEQATQGYPLDTSMSGSTFRPEPGQVAAAFGLQDFRPLGSVAAVNPLGTGQIALTGLSGAAGLAGWEAQFCAGIDEFPAGTSAPVLGFSTPGASSVSGNPPVAEVYTYMFLSSGTWFYGLGLLDVLGGGIGVGTSVPVVAGQVRHFRLLAWQVNPTDIGLTLYIDGAVGVTGALTGNLMLPAEIRTNPLGRVTTDSDSSVTSLSHLAAWSPMQSTSNVTGALGGWAGESARARIARLCDEESVPCSVTDGESSLMGPQPVDSLVPLLRDTEKTDRGILDDRLGRVSYRSLAELYNPVDRFALDGKDRQLFMPFEPTTDDLRRRNDVTASRPGGSSSRVVDGPNVRRVGRYNDGPQVNVYLDSALSSQASWRIREGTVAGKRYPSVTVDLLRAPELIADWLATLLGDVVRITNPPRQHTKGNVRLMLRGRTQVWTGRRGGWVATCNAIRADPYEVQVVASLAGEGNNRGRVDLADTSTLATRVGATETSISVTTTTCRWIDSAAYPALFPFDLDFDGEPVTVTAITGTTSPQTFAVRRSITGIRRQHAAGAYIRLRNAAAYGRGS